MILVKPPILVNSEVFKMYHGQDATKQLMFNLSNISSDKKVTLSIRNADGKVVIGEYNSDYKVFELVE